MENMTKRILFGSLIAIGILAPQAAFGRLGETAKQIEERYGASTPAVRTNPDIPCDFARQYSFRGYRITVNFKDGISQSESYGKRGLFSAEEINTILEANAGGSTWRAVRMLPEPFMETTDGKAVGIHSIGNGLLIVTMRPFYNEWMRRINEHTRNQKTF